MEDNKVCVFCKRDVTGKRRLGMCPRCFANVMDMIAIVVFPIIAILSVLVAIIPDFIPVVDEVLCAIVIICSLVIPVMCIVRIIRREKML